MALIEPYMVMTVEGNEDLVLKAEAYESFLIKDIIVFNPASDYVECRVEKTVTGFFRAGGLLGNHLAVPPEDSTNQTLLSRLYDLGLWRGIPVDTGQKFTLSGIAQAGAIQIVIYEQHDAGDMLPDMPNGRTSLTYDYLNYGRLSTFVDGDNRYDTLQNPVEYPDFPYTDDVPSKTMMTVFGVLASDVGVESGGGANSQVSKYLKLIKERTTYFDKERKGVPMIGITPGADQVDIGKGQANFGNYNDIDQRNMLLFPQPLIFTEGEELNIFLTTELLAGVPNLTALNTEIALIQRLDPAGL